MMVLFVCCGDCLCIDSSSGVVLFGNGSGDRLKVVWYLCSVDINVLYGS